MSISLDILVKNLKEKGHSVFVATPGVPDVNYPRYILPLPVLPLNIFKSVLEDVLFPVGYEESMEKFFIRNNVEIIHSHETGVMFDAAQRIAKKMNIPHVHTYHTMLEEYVKVLHPLGYRKMARYISKRACNYADIVIAPTEKINKYLQNIGVKKKIVTILNIPNIDHLRKTEPDESTKKRLGIKDDDFVFLSFGRVVKQKSIDKSIDYLEPVLRKHKNAKFIIAGFGPSISSLKEYVEEKDLEKQIILTGGYDKEELLRLANISNCFVITSKSETQGITVLEAMACGLPVLAIDDPAYDYILEDGYNGYALTEENFSRVAEELSKNNELARKLSLNAMQSAQKLRQKDFTTDYIDVYQQVIDQANQK